MRFIKGVLLVIAAASVGAVGGFILTCAGLFPFRASREDFGPALWGMVFGAPGGAFVAVIATIVWLIRAWRSDHQQSLTEHPAPHLAAEPVSASDAQRVDKRFRWNAGTWAGGAVGLVVGFWYAYQVGHGQILDEEGRWFFLVFSVFGAAVGGTLGTVIAWALRQ
jgi:hypothetical protein